MRRCPSFCLLLAALCAVLGLSSAEALAKVRNPDGIAVIIGNRNYTGAGDVKYAHRDAEAFRRYVVALGVVGATTFVQQTVGRAFHRAQQPYPRSIAMSCPTIGTPFPGFE